MFQNETQYMLSIKDNIYWVSFCSSFLGITLSSTTSFISSKAYLLDDVRSSKNKNLEVSRDILEE